MYTTRQQWKERKKVCSSLPLPLSGSLYTRPSLPSSPLKCVSRAELGPLLTQRYTTTLTHPLSTEVSTVQARGSRSWTSCQLQPSQPLTSARPAHIRDTRSAAGTRWARPSLELYKDLLNYTGLTKELDCLGREDFASVIQQILLSRKA